MQIKKISFLEAVNIAQTYDVSSPMNSVVLYSVSFLPTKQNKFNALDYIKNNKYKMLIDDTICGKKLIELGLDDGTSGLPDNEVREVWQVASKRFIMEAKGEVRAFVNGADPRSVFISVELPLLLQNPNITTINDIGKIEFSKNVI